MNNVEFNPLYWQTNRQHLTVEQREEIQQRFWDGETVPMLAKEFNVTPSSIRNWIVPRRERL